MSSGKKKQYEKELETQLAKNIEGRSIEEEWNNIKQTIEIQQKKIW